MNFKVIFKCMLLAGLPFLAACNSDDTDLQMVQPLQLCVSTGVSESRAVVDGWFLPEGGQLGVSLVAADGSAYDGKSYNNIPYTATGNGYDTPQTWSCTGSVVPSLSTTLGKAVAYYPYNESVTDLTAIPIETASQTDYMYSGWYSYLYYATPKANLTMNHAMAVLKLYISTGRFDNFESIDKVTSLELVSNMFGTSAILNATDGTLSNISVATVDDQADNRFVLNIEPEDFFVLSEDGNYYIAEILVIPTIPAESGFISLAIFGDIGGSIVAGNEEICYPTINLKQGSKYIWRIEGNGGGPV